MKLVAVLRIKNEMPVVEECLSKLSSLVDEVIVLDNGSTDGTLDCYKKFAKIVEILHTEGYHEGRDKCLLLEAVKKRNPDWILWIDGDEIFEKNFTRKEIEKYMQSPYNQILFRMFNFWLSKEDYRIDGDFFRYTIQPQRSMWRNIEGAYFSNKKMHNGGIRGINSKIYLSPYRLKHYGYRDQEKIKSKYQTYMQEDSQRWQDYQNLNLNRPSKIIKLKFWEFNNPIINLTHITIIKQVANWLWFFVKVKSKFS